MTREQLNNVYLEWVNNYLTIEKYAEHKGLHVDEATTLINLARDAHRGERPEY